MVITRTVKSLCLGMSLFMILGCGHRFETGYHDFGKVQVQFFAPAGSTVTVGEKFCGAIGPDRSHQVSAYGTPSAKLERNPEETATFNLAPGRYEFKYTAAPGWEGASVYGEVQIFNVCGLMNPEGREMISRCFIPVALPSPGTESSVPADVNLYPYSSAGHRLNISMMDVERLQAGDMVTKVVFIADLKKAKHELSELEVDYAKMTGKRQQLRALYNEAQLDALDNPKEDKFIHLQAELKELDQKMVRNEDRTMRLKSLLEADKVLIRREMMVLATDEILPAHENPIEAAQRMGQVVLVMRLGGRHLHWGNYAQEASAFNK